VVEYSAHVEANDTVACAAVYGWYRMTDWWSDCGYAMAGIAAEVGDNGGRVVGIGTEETDSRVAVAAFGSSIRMRRCGCLANRHRAVVTAGAGPGNSSMIEAAVRVQCEKAGGIVAVVALGVGRQMRCGFTDRQNPVMALAATAEYFLVINIRNYVETQRGMTGLAHAAGSDVIR
jgi:hypothetical protein